MHGLETTVLLGATVLAGAVLAPRLRIATPLLLVLAGLALGFLPALRAIELPPETVLLLFLPVLLFWESLTTSLRAVRRDFRGIVILSTVLVVASAVGAAWVVSLFGTPWTAALVLGAAVAPPDATAAAALARTLPRRQFMLLKAESLTNDGTALVVFAIAVSSATGAHWSQASVTGLVLLSYGGGLVAGTLTAGLAYLVMRSVNDPTALNVALLLTPFTAYLAAELVGASGVLAVVVAGLALAYLSGRITTAASRRQTESAWPLGAYVLNGALFVLIGLQVQSVLHDVEPSRVGRLLASVVAVWLALAVIRFVVPQLAVLVIRAVDRRPAQQARRMSHRARVVSAVAGFRGAVSLALALSVPTALDDGSPFPGRDDVVLVTAGVVLLTLLVQGPLLPVVLRWADLPRDDTEQVELIVAEREIVTRALDALDDLASRLAVDDEVRQRLAREQAEHLAMVEARDASGAGETIRPDDAATLQREDDYVRLRLALLARKREVLHRLRRTGAVDDTVARGLQSRLDVEEIRLTGVEPLD